MTHWKESEHTQRLGSYVHAMIVVFECCKTLRYVDKSYQHLSLLTLSVDVIDLIEIFRYFKCMNFLR